MGLPTAISAFSAIRANPALPLEASADPMSTVIDAAVWMRVASAGPFIGMR